LNFEPENYEFFVSTRLMWFNKPSECCTKSKQTSLLFCDFIYRLYKRKLPCTQYFAAILHTSPFFCSESKAQIESFLILSQNNPFHVLDESLF
tara:strand:+ start:24758 stop:25036 length:279 start_codon:yes stop_codon:yes gene_type:complete